MTPLLTVFSVYLNNVSNKIFTECRVLVICVQQFFFILVKYCDNELKGSVKEPNMFHL